jgi:hypothetical protein
MHYTLTLELSSMSGQVSTVRRPPTRFDVDSATNNRTVHTLLEKNNVARYNVFIIKYLDYQDIISRRQNLSRTSGSQKLKESERRRVLMEQLQFLGEVVNTETALFQHLAAAQHGWHYRYENIEYFASGRSNDGRGDWKSLAPYEWLSYHSNRPA